MFENKEVLFMKSNGFPVLCKVISCEEGIGVSLVKKEDEKTFVFCLNMEKSPLLKDKKWTMAEKLMAIKVYEYVYECIENKKTIYEVELIDIFSFYNQDISYNASCA